MKADIITKLSPIINVIISAVVSYLISRYEIRNHSSEILPALFVQENLTNIKNNKNIDNYDCYKIYKEIVQDDIGGPVYDLRLSKVSFDEAETITDNLFLYFTMPIDNALMVEGIIPRCLRRIAFVI